jgi:hypothetical protein
VAGIVCVNGMDLNQSVSQRAPALKSRSLLLLLVFTGAVFTSALLLFAVQPMFTRMVLPRLGGSPSVWSVAMVFFQSMLLAGYAYAHVLMRPKRRVLAVVVHFVLLMTAGLMLPLSIATGWGDPPATGAAFWLLGLFAASIGLPFFALSANNPLLQAWFARTDHPDANDPYFLYAASNIGSFLALVSYPVLWEPALSLQAQNRLWSGGFWLLAALIAGCGYLLLRSPQDNDAGVTAARATPAPDWRALVRWMFLAAVPSGLLVAVTAHISTDIAAVPLLWVIPLSIYLLTWVLVFQSKPLLPHKWLLLLQPFALAALVVLFRFSSDESLPLMLSGHLLAFFIIAMASHGELARLRPPADHLTVFYLSLSAGGMIGGLFAGLIAPYTFSWIAEYPVLLALAALCLPPAAANWDTRERLSWIVALIAAAAVILPGLLGWIPSDTMTAPISVIIITIAVATVLLTRKRLKIALAIGVALAMVRLYPVDQGRSESVRSFFGVHKIYETLDGQYRVLLHGTTIHGAQKLKEGDGTPARGRPEPLTYYHRESPLAAAIDAIRKRKAGPLRVAVVGLGAGSLACYVEPGESWRFFEIDPSVIEIARDPRRFAYVHACAPDLPIVLGDARLTLAHEPDRHYDLMIIDAYSSDSIPIHLATREAMAIYKAKIADDGVVVMHLSNRHLELTSVVAGIAAANGLRTWVIDDGKEDDKDDDAYIFTSTVTISAVERGHIGQLAEDEDWQLTEPDETQRVWTDDYSNIVGALWRKYQ